MALSSCEAEIIALSECSKDVIYYRKKLIGIDPSYVSAPTNASTDNKGAHDLSYNPEFHARSKHIKRRHFYACATWWKRTNWWFPSSRPTSTRQTSLPNRCRRISSSNSGTLS